MTRCAAVLVGVAATFVAGTTHGVIIDFEDFAADGGLVNVSPEAPYTAHGFALVPTDDFSAVFDAAHTNAQMPGNATDWFGFAESNTPTLTLTSGGMPFDMRGAVIGPSTIGAGTVSMTITGNLVGGGTVSETFNNLVTATAVDLNFNHLASADFVTSDDAGLDDILVFPVPEPSTWTYGVVSLLAGCCLWVRGRAAVKA